MRRGGGGVILLCGVVKGAKISFPILSLVKKGGRGGIGRLKLLPSSREVRDGGR